VGKNGNGEGNIRQRPDGRWEARYCVETPEGPKRRSVYGKTRKEVAEKLAVKLANKDTEPVQKVEQATITARDFFAEYLAAMKDTIKRRSYETSNDIIRLHEGRGGSTTGLTPNPTPAPEGDEPPIDKAEHDYPRVPPFNPYAPNGGSGGNPGVTPREEQPTPEQEARIEELVKQGRNRWAARCEVLAKDHPLYCECAVCL
jgi:hypothetical protein